jgi:hypothetical protein
MRGGDYDVFVSYARSDAAAATELNNWLRGQGLATFFDRSELRPGLPWVPALEEAINRSRAVAILFGKHGIGNTQQYERQFALVRQTHEAAFPVIPVLMPGCESPPTGFLQLLTWVDLSKAASILQQLDSLASLRAALRGEAIAASAIRARVCPYRGLEPFREEDAPFFCGRDEAIRELVAKVEAHAFVAVVGASGSGKSSLVFAGLLPALRKESQTRTWDVVSFRPGMSPLGALAAAFGIAPENAGPAEIDAYLEREAEFYRDGDVDTLTRIVDRRLDGAPEKPDRLLIYIDQWEELYAMAPAAEDKERFAQHTSDVDKFIGLLVAATSGVRSRATVVLTVRADFYNPLVQSPLISRLLAQQQVIIPPMGSGDLRSAIETPAKNAGLSFSPPELVDQILNDVGSEEGRLPLLQFALKETWERREENKLTAEAYTAVGGVVGAIEKSAASVYNRLTPGQQDAARRLFLRLVTPGEGQEDTRARSLIPNDPQQRDVIKLFSDPKTRLLVTGFAPLQASGQPGGDVRATVEVAHEALIQRWPTLQTWVNGNREKLRARAAILRAMAEWNENGRIDRFLLDPGVQLERGRGLVEDPGDVPVDDLRDFVARSIKREKDRLSAEREAALADQKRIADAERQAKEAAQQRALAEEQARKGAEASARKLRRALAAVAGATILALVLFGLSVREYQQASRQLERADYESRRASEQTRETQRQLERADHALAQSIIDALVSNDWFAGQQRNALWTLAVADDAVRSYVVSGFANSPPNMARVSGGIGYIFRALGVLRPSPAEAEMLLAAAIAVPKSTESTADDAEQIQAAIEALAAKISEAQARQALDLLLQQTEQTDQGTNRNAPLALGGSVRALLAKLSETQAQQVLDSLLKQIGEATRPDMLEALTQALPAKLTEAQTQRALDPVLKKLAQINDPDAFGRTMNPYAAQALARALRALADKLTEAQAQGALDPVLKLIGQTTDSETLRALTQALRALPAKLTNAQAHLALDPVLRLIGQTTDADELQALAGTLESLAPKLTEAQAQSAFDTVLKQLGQAEDQQTLEAFVQALRALPAKLTDSQAQKAIAPLLKRLVEITDFKTLGPPREAILALVAKLTDAQAQQTLDRMLRQMGQTTKPYALWLLAEVLQALPAKLTEAQAQRALDPVLQGIDKTTNADALSALIGVIRLLAANLSAAQAQQAWRSVDVVLHQFGQTTDTEELQKLGYPLARAIQSLPAQLTEAHTQQVLDLILQRIDRITKPSTLMALAQLLQSLPGKLTDEQAQKALDSVLRQIGQTDELATLAEALQALTPKLSKAQAQLASKVAVSSLAWAVNKEEATDWARALVALLSRAADGDGTTKLVAAVAYPTVAGPATDVLLDEIRGRHSDAPPTEAGTQASLAWLGAKYPWILRPPVCPPPPQTAEKAGLICPSQGTEASANSLSNAPKVEKGATAH